MKKLIVNILATLSVAITLTSYSSMANADSYHPVVPGSRCQTMILSAVCMFSNALLPPLFAGQGIKGASVMAKPECWKPGTKWAVKVSAQVNRDYAANTGTLLGTFPLHYSSPLPHDRGGVFYVNGPSDASKREYFHAKVEILGTTRNCIESVSFFAYP